MKTLTPRLLIATALALAALLLTAPARAQSCRDADLELRSTDRALEVVSAAARESGERAALARLDEAIQVQAQAKRAFSVGRCPLAARLARKAHEIANQVLVSVRPGVGDRRVGPGFVRRELERTDEILSRVAPRVKESGNDRAQIVLDRAGQQQGRAWDLFRQATLPARPDAGALGVALEQTSRARDAARQALNLATQDVGADPDRVAEELRQTDEQIATAVEWSRSNPAASPTGLEQLDAARGMEERARRHFDQREYPEALRLTLRARDQVARVLSGSAQVDPADLARALQAAQAALDQAREASLPPAGQQLLAQAGQRYDRALQQRDAGHPWVALMNARAARNLALRALGAPPP